MIAYLHWLIFLNEASQIEIQTHVSEPKQVEFWRLSLSGPYLAGCSGPHLSMENSKASIPAISLWSKRQILLNTLWAGLSQLLLPCEGLDYNERYNNSLWFGLSHSGWPTFPIHWLQRSIMVCVSLLEWHHAN